MAVRKKRCSWVKSGDHLSETYHDTEWGVPTFDDRVLFEFLILESAQAGLSWDTILRKRAAYRKAFAQFDPKKISRFTDADVTRLMNDAGIVRNRLKITSTISGARIFLALQKEYGSFAAYAWQYVGGIPRDHARKTLRDIPTVSPEAEAFSKDMRKRGFKFFGPTIAYAYLQATGMINDHTTDCFRYQKLHASAKKKPTRG